MIDGNETIKDIIQKGDLFGELTLETDNKNKNTQKYFRMKWQFVVF